MTPADAARILAVAALYDRRTVGETDAIAWADALNELDPRACAEAVRAHYRGNDVWVMPSHVRDLVKRAQRDAGERDRNARQLAAIEAAKVSSDTDRAEEAKQAARAEFARVVAERTAACGECDDQAHVLLEGKPTRERCTHPNIRRSA